MRAKANIEVFFESPDAAGSAAAALAGESGFSRARSRVDRESSRLVVAIDADDVVALRAAANGFLRSLQVFEHIENDIE